MITRSQVRVRCLWGACAAIHAIACSPAAPRAAPALPPNAFAFGVFGDGPYNSGERGRFQRLLVDVDGANVEWLLHVGDIISVPCSDALLEERRGVLNAMRTPVVYTPGDNEWTDCRRQDSGNYEPLERLAHIRKTFFAKPHASLGARSLTLEAQSDSAQWPEFVENARWRRGGFLFVTLHMVGSANGGAVRAGDSVAQKAEVARRSEAALQWLDAAFAIARADSLRGVVLAMHGDPGFNRPGGSWPAYARFVQRLASHTSAFAGSVLLIHGDHHTFRVDHPLTHGDRGDSLANFTRLETFGSPDIGWVRVVIDSSTGRILTYEQRLMRRGLFR